MRSNGATFRLVVGNSDHSFTGTQIAVAVERAAETSIEETEEEVQGTLEGTLPNAHAFEFRSLTGDVLNGRVDRELSSELLATWNTSIFGSSAVARILVRKVKRRGAVSRQTYTLLSLAILEGPATETVPQLR